MTEDPKSKLGRGLEALFEESARPAPQGAGAGAGRARLAGGGSAVLPVSDLAPGPFPAARDLRRRGDGGADRPPSGSAASSSR